MLLLRLSPLLPLALSNYLYGLTSVDFAPYVLGSWLGMLPGTFAYVSAGALLFWMCPFPPPAAVRQGVEAARVGGMACCVNMGSALVCDRRSAQVSEAVNLQGSASIRKSCGKISCDNSSKICLCQLVSTLQYALSLQPHHQSGNPDPIAPCRHAQSTQMISFSVALRDN